jgi:tetratricopeptide (TPR) repeat protein
VSSRRIPSWEVAYLAGRCDFRRGRLTEAARHYETALSRRSSAEGRAEIGVHLARAHELNGRLDLAVEAARRAVVARTTDDRRLFLARLRLRLDQPDKARAGLAKVKGRTARTRGEMMLALYDIKTGRTAEARSRLENVRRRPWNGPAAVIAAGLALDAGDHDAALRGLEGATSSMDSYWAGKARAHMKLLPPELTEQWRQEMTARLTAGDSRSRRKTLATWSTLEFDPAVVARLRSEVSRTVALDTPEAEPDLPPGLAHDLWSVGLPSEAVRWNPRGMPVGDVNQATWTARQFAELELPWQAIRTADGAWRMAGADIPTRGYPLSLQRSLHPLPDPDLVWRTAVERAVPWSLVAGIAREESRWRPTVVSVVGARGLMQLMPATSAAVATHLGMTPPTLEGLFDPGVSLTLGGAEINRLLAVFDGQLEPAVAAYNAGEAQAKLWLDQCGTPCRSEWYVATITFTATNGYTRDVIASAATYVELYGATPRVISERSVRSWQPEGPATAHGR